MSKIIGYMCGSNIYRFQEWFFEIHRYCGPWPLKKKDGDPR